RRAAGGRMTDYVIVTGGGGVGGAAVARAMAERGARVLVVERERQFRGGVRGELLVSWGVAEAEGLGLGDLLRHGCGHELRWNDLYLGGMQIMRRDYVATTPQAAPLLAFYHPAMQEALLAAAARAGAEVRRGATVRRVASG